MCSEDVCIGCKKGAAQCRRFPFLREKPEGKEAQMTTPGRAIFFQSAGKSSKQIQLKTSHTPMPRNAVMLR